MVLDMETITVENGVSLDEYVAHVARCFFCEGGNEEDAVHLEMLLDALDGFFAI